jgi:peptidoglycan L-alanyl-D-glutamate endopeptidase CwlK
VTTTKKAAGSKPKLPATPPASAPSKSAEWTLDARSAKNIATLDPATAKLAKEHLRLLAAEGLSFKVTSGTRTMAEQAKLYAQGRTTPGPIVTKAKPGSSWHNFGVAYDLTLFANGKPVWESPAYDRAGAVGKSLGLKWGGDFKSFKDRPHFERSLDMTLAQARAAGLALS